MLEVRTWHDGFSQENVQPVKQHSVFYKRALEYFSHVWFTTKAVCIKWAVHSILCHDLIAWSFSMITQIPIWYLVVLRKPRSATVSITNWYSIADKPIYILSPSVQTFFHQSGMFSVVISRLTYILQPFCGYTLA